MYILINKFLKSVTKYDKENLLVCQNVALKCNNYCRFHKFNQFSFIEVRVILNGNEEGDPESEYSVL